MSQTIINVGTNPDDGTGSPLRTAFTDCNSNFTELYSRTPGFSPTPLCMSNDTGVGLNYNTYILTVSDSLSIFNRCKVYVDNVSPETTFIQVGVYTNDYGGLVDGLESFKSTNPDPLPLKLVALFDTTTGPIKPGVVELAQSEPTESVIDQGQNVVVAISLNENISLLGHNKGFNQMPGMFLLGEQLPLTEDISENLSNASSADRIPSVQFYKKSASAPD